MQGLQDKLAYVPVQVQGVHAEVKVAPVKVTVARVPAKIPAGIGR